MQNPLRSATHVLSVPKSRPKSSWKPIKNVISVKARAWFAPTELSERHKMYVNPPISP